MADLDEKKEPKQFPLIGVDPGGKQIELDYDTITDKELIDLIKKTPKEVLIVDVRDPDPEDGDYIGGHINGAINIPSFDLVDNLPKLITEENVAQKKVVVFHCMMSKGRGPQTYRLYNKARELLGKKKEESNKDDEFNKIVSGIKLSDKSLSLLKDQKVVVLKGGFHTFLNYHKDEKELFEDFDGNFYELTKLEGDDNEGYGLYHKNEQ